MNQQQHDALSMLARIGPTNRSELVDLINDLSLSILSELEVSKLIKVHMGDVDTVVITMAGKRAIGIATARTHVTHVVESDDSYSGIELAPNSFRPGCNDALLLPSRYGNELRYRNGKKATI